MNVEAYNAVRPGSPGRTLACAMVLLGIVLALAASLSRARSQELLGDRIEVLSWNLSLRPPKHFVPGDVVRSSRGEVLPFHRRTGIAAILAVRRFPLNPGDDPASICLQLLRDQTEEVATFVLTAPTLPSIAALGRFDAVELMATDRMTIVRVAFLDQSVGLAMELYVDGSAIDDSLRDVFDETCRSIQVK